MVLLSTQWVHIVCAGLEDVAGVLTHVPAKAHSRRGLENGSVELEEELEGR